MDVFDFGRVWQSFAGRVLELLPQSPTVDSEALETLSRYASYINYVFPVGKFLAFVSLTLVAVGAYYLAMIVLRMIKLIG